MSAILRDLKVPRVTRVRGAEDRGEGQLRDVRDDVQHEAGVNGSPERRFDAEELQVDEQDRRFDREECWSEENILNEEFLCGRLDLDDDKCG